MISNSEVEDLILKHPLRDGESIRVNHHNEHCYGSSKSAKFSRDGSTYALHCWRCGGTMRLRKEGSYKSLYKSKSKESRWTLPKDVKSFPDWNVKALAWILKYISKEEVNSASILWSDSTERLYFPMINNGVVYGWHGRSFNEEKSKYLTIHFGEKSKLFGEVKVNDTVVLVEDYISFIKIKTLKIYSAICTFGTDISKDLLFYIVNNYKRVIIFWDNDNNIVKKKQRLFNNKFLLYGLESKVIQATKDPKEYSTEDLTDGITTR